MVEVLRESVYAKTGKLLGLEDFCDRKVEQKAQEMTSVLLLCTLISPILANGYYHQEYNYQTSSSSYKNHELQHHNEDEGFYSKDGDLEGRLRPRVNAHSQHSEYVNPKMQHGYRIGTDRTSSFGQLHAQNRYRMNEPFEGGAYGMMTPVHNYGVTSNLRQVTESLQREMEAELQQAVYDHAQRAMAYGGITQAQIDTDRRVLEEELRRNVTMRLQEALKMQYGNQGIRGAYSYSIQNGRLQPTANYNNQELADLTRQMEENLIRHLEQQVQTYYRTEVHTHTQRNTYRVNGGEYPGALQARPPVYHPYPPPHPNPVLAKPDSITTVATRVQTELNEILNKILEDTQKRYFAENSYQNPSINYDAILAHLQDELRANITFHFDDQIKRAYGYSNYASKYSVEDIENLRRQIEANLITKLNRDFNRQRERFFQTHQIYQPIPANHVFYPANQVHQVDVGNLQRQMQEQLSRQLQEALMRQSYSQAMYSGGVSSQAHYQRALEQLSAELNRNLTRQMEQLNAQQYQIGVHDSQLAAMRNQLQHDLMRQLQQGLQQSYSQYSSWSSSSRSSSNSHNYRPVRGFDANLYRQYGTSSDLVGEDCMMGDDPGTQRTKRGALTQQNEDLTQQTEDLTQQTEDLTQQTEDLTQQSQDLTQQTQDLTQQTENLTHQSQEMAQDEDLSQKTEDLTQQVQTQNDLRKPGIYGQKPAPIRALTQSQDLTQQRQDLTQQVKTLDDLEKPNSYSQNQAPQRTEDVFGEPQSQDLTQQTQDLTQPKYHTQIGPSISQKPVPNYYSGFIRPTQDLTQQSQDLTQPESPRYVSQNGPSVSQKPVPNYQAEYYHPSQDNVGFIRPKQDLTQQTQDLTQPKYYSQLGPSISQDPVSHYHARYVRPSQDLTQQTQDLAQPKYNSQFGPSIYQNPMPQYQVDYVQPSQDLTQQSEDLTQTEKPKFYSQISPTVYQKPVPVMYQQVEYVPPTQDLTQPGKPKLYSQTGPGVYQKPVRVMYHQVEYVSPTHDLTQQSAYQQIPNAPRNQYLTQQSQDLTQQSQDLTQQSQDQVDIGPPDSYQQSVVDTEPLQGQDLTQQSQDLTQNTEPLIPLPQEQNVYRSRDPAHFRSTYKPISRYEPQSQDLTQQSQDQVDIGPPDSYQQSPVDTEPLQSQDLTQHSQDLTQNSEPLIPLPQERNVYRPRDPAHFRSTYKPTSRYEQQSQDFTQNSEPFIQRQERQNVYRAVDPTYTSTYSWRPQRRNFDNGVGQRIQYYENLNKPNYVQQTSRPQSQDMTQQSQDLTQQSQDLTQQTQNFGQPIVGPPEIYQPLSQFATAQQSQDLTQVENINQPIEPQLSSNKIPKDLTQQSQDLTQQSQDLTQQSQDLTQQSQDLTQQSQDLTQEIQPEAPTTPPTAQNKALGLRPDQKRLTQAQQESQHLIDLLRRESQKDQNQNIGTMNYSPQPVYADYDGHQIQVGTTRQLGPHDAQVDTIPNQETQTVRDIEPVEPQVASEVQQVDETQTVRDIEPVEPQVASEVQQVDDNTAITTKKPGWWSRLGTSIKNKIG